VPSSRLTRPQKTIMTILLTDCQDTVDAKLRSDPKFIGRFIKNTCTPLREDLDRCCPDDKEKRKRLSRALAGRYEILRHIAKTASKTVVAEMVGSNGFSSYSKHICMVLRELSSSPRWTKTGVLSDVRDES